MNKTEALATAMVIDWLATVRAVETDGDVTDDQLRRAVATLAAASRNALMTGRTDREVTDLLDQLLTGPTPAHATPAWDQPVLIDP